MTDPVLSGWTTNAPPPTHTHTQRERMAIMEAAISSSLSHPNIVQVRDRHANYMSRMYRASCFPLCLSLFLSSPYGHLIN